MVRKGFVALAACLLMAFLLSLASKAYATAYDNAEVFETGQTSCWDSSDPSTETSPCYNTSTPATNIGQDGYYKWGVSWPTPTRFMPNYINDGVTPDGTITDTLTGLMWTQDGSTLDATCADGSHANCSGGTCTWPQAMAYVACLNASPNTNANLCYSDWRLPNAFELRSLVNYQQPSSPNASVAAWLITQRFLNVQLDFYWSSTTYAYNTPYVWCVRMWDGVVDLCNKTNDVYYVWPVRGGQSGSFDSLDISVSSTSAGTSTGSNTDTIPAGGTDTYTLTVTNSGPNPATDVYIVDTIASGASNITNINITSPGTCCQSGGLLKCNITPNNTTLAASGTATVAFTVTYAAAGTYTNWATVSTTSNDTNAVNNTSSFTTTVNKATTTTAIASSWNPSTYGSSVSFTATVTNGSLPTGTVTFYDNGSAITGCTNPATLSGSAPYNATCTTSTLSLAGSPHSITAVYGGDSNNAGSASSAITQTVNEPPPPPPPPTAALTVSLSGTVWNAQVVRVTSNIGGINCTYNGTSTAGSVCTTALDIGTPVTLTATVPAGTTLNWGSGCDSHTATTCTVNSLTADIVIPVTTAVSTATVTVTPSGPTYKNGTVTITSNAGGINCTYNGTAPAGGTCTSSAQLYGTPVTLTAVLPVGTSITWSGCNPPYPPSGGINGAGNTCTISSLTANTTVTATTSVSTPTLTVTPSGPTYNNGTVTITSDTGGINCMYNGTSTAGTCTSSGIVYGTPVTISAVTPVGTNVAWSGCSAAGNICTISALTANTTITVTASVPTATLSVSPSGTVSNGKVVSIASNTGGINCTYNGTSASGTCTSSPINTGAINAIFPLVLTATVPPGTTLNWGPANTADGSGCDATTATTCTLISLTANKTISVTTTVSTATVTVTPSGPTYNNGTVTITSSIGGIDCTWNGTFWGGTYQSTALMYGTPVTLTATLPAGTNITWSGCSSSSGNVCTISSLTSNTTIKATTSVAPIPAHPPVYDFNGDGKSDILLYNSTPGAIAEWLMNGTTVIGGGYVTTSLDTSWQIKGVGDFNGDGMSDILLQNSTTGAVAVWLLNGSAVIGGDYVATSLDTSWQIKGVGDFNGDGTSDILLYNSTTGAVAEWLMGGTTIIGSGYVFSPVLPGSGWQIKGVGDFNGDGMSDILLYNSITGSVVVWLLNGSTVIGGGYVPSPVLPSSGWQIMGVRDFNGDGNSDILWYNSTTGVVAQWLLNGSTVIGGGYVSSSVPPGSGWQME